jgi:uncharacterized protein YgfB (UPF0149 family)
MDRWLEEIIPDAERRSDDDSQQVLRLLYADTLNAMRGDEMSLEVLLPDDDVPLEARAGGLSQWCQGFLYGFGTGQPVDAASLPENVGEILRDLTHIGRATVSLEAGEGDNEEENEEEEEAYTEVVEYVRVGVQLIHDELIEARANPAAAHDEGSADEEGSAEPGRDAAEDDDGDGEPGTLH